jgi:hypothetical protein
MYCGRCCATEPRSKLHLRLDIFIEIPIFVRSLSEKERGEVEDSLRSKDAFTMRRAQILLASCRGEHAPKIATNLGCAPQTVRDAIHETSTSGAWTRSPRSPRAQSGPAMPSTKGAPRRFGR